ELPAHGQLDALPRGEAEQGVCPCLHSVSVSLFRTLYAMRDCSDQISMKPGLACWEKSPPDSPKPASAGSYSAFGERRATGRTLPLNSRSVISPVTCSLTASMKAFRSLKSGSY